MKNALFKTTCAVGAAVLAAGVQAQGIQRVSEPYGQQPSLPIAAPVKAPPIAAPAQSWDIQLKDINFANVFHRWASKAGYRVRWDAQKHFLVEAPDNVAGTFEEAVAIVLESPGIAQSAYPLEVCIYPNTPPLARITRRGEQDKECK